MKKAKDRSRGSNMEKNNMGVQQNAFIERQNCCPLCGTQLEIRVESYLEEFTLREEAHCPECDVLARVKDHKMQ